MSTFVEQIAISLDLGNNEIKNLVIDKLATEPSTGLVEGRIYYNSADNKYGYYDGTAWQYFETVSRMTAALALKQNNISFEDNSPLSFGEGQQAAQLKIALSTSIAASGSDSDSKVATEKAVRNLHDGIPAEQMTLTNKIFDANGEGNSLTNVEVADFAQNVVKTDLTGTLTDAQLVTAKAVKAAIDAASVEAMLYRGAWTITADSAAASKTSAGITSVAVDLDTFKAAASPADSGNYEFSFDGTNWSLSGTNVTLATYGVTFAGIAENGDTITVAYTKGTSDFSGLAAMKPINKGDVFAIAGTGPVTISDVEYNPGDHLICNTSMKGSDAVTGDKFDKIDNTEAADLVRLNASQRLTNKTIDADENTISDLTLANLKSGVLVTSLTTAQADDSTVASAKAVQTAINSASPHVDDSTIQAYKANESDPYYTLRVKADGITMNEMAPAAVSKSASETKNNAQLVTQQKVADDIEAFRTATKTLTNKTLDLAASGEGAGQNSITNATLGIFASGVKQESVRSSSAATNTSFATELAVRTELDTKQDKVTTAVENHIATWDSAGNTKDSDKAFVTTLAPASGEGAATNDQVPTALAVRTAVDAASASAAAAAHIVVIPTTNESNFQLESGASPESATWTVATPWTGHDVLSAKLLDKNGNEVHCHIQYGMTEGNNPVGYVEFGINCSASDTFTAGDYKALIVG